MSHTLTTPEAFETLRERIVIPFADTRTSIDSSPELPDVSELEEASDLSALLSSNLAWIDERLLEHGALLFRGCGVRTVAQFQEFAHAISSSLPDFVEESSPRSVVSGKVMTSTNYPSEFLIQFHNEYSYSYSWPMRLYFFCIQPAIKGGETPIADSRRVLSRLSAELRAKFASRGVMYKRNYTEGLGVPWTTAFGTTDRTVVEDYCRKHGIQYKWQNGDRLTTTHIGPAIVRHPVTGQETWFNHAFFFNVRALEPGDIRDYLLRAPESEISTNTCYGDGESIEPEAIEEIRAAYEAESVAFSWQSGDILLVDNMLVAHARRPFTGERKVVVVMGDECSRHLTRTNA